MADDIIIKIRADISDAEAKIKKAGKGLNDLEDAAKGADSPVNKIGDSAKKAGDKLNFAGNAGANAAGGLKNVPGAANAAASSLDKAAKSSDRAGQALLNIGRVAQDAPFGFLGIANNLNPLLESFQRLQAETGSVKASLKALGSSILGAGGIGLALSLFQFLALGGADAIKKLFSSTKDLKFAELKKQADDFAKALKDVEAGALSTGLQLQSFVAIARDQTQSLATRNEALEKANKILGDHADKLTLVNINTKAVTEEINNFTKALVLQAVSTKYADRAAELFIKQRDAATDYGKELQKLTDYQKKYKMTETSLTGEERISSGGAAIIKQTKIVKEAVVTYQAITKELQKVTGDLQSTQLSATKLFGTLKGSEALGIIGKIRKEIEDLTKEQPNLTSQDAITKSQKRIDFLQDELDRLLGKTKRTKESIGDVLSELSREIEFLNKKEIAFNTNETKAKLSAYFSTIEKLIKNFKVDPQSTLVNKLFGTAADIKIKDLLSRAQKNIQEQPPIEIPFTFAPQGVNENILGTQPSIKLPQFNSADVDDAKKISFLTGQGVAKAFQDGFNIGVKGLRSPNLDDLYEKYKTALDNFGSSVNKETQQIFINIFTAIGDSLGQAISGSDVGDIFKNFFATILKAIGAGIRNIGIAALGATKVILAIKATIGKLPGVAIAIGAIALGTAISLLAEKLTATPKFATGGLVGGTGNRDTVNALLTPGEFVMTRAAVSRIGVDNLAALNRGSSPTAAIGAGVEGGALTVNGSIIGVVSGKDLRLILNRADASLGRVG